MSFSDWKFALERRCKELLACMPPECQGSTKVETVPAKSAKASTKVYLAGRISRNDWRHQLVASVDESRDGFGDREVWERTTEFPMRDGNTYVGPFFIGCDHGCGHGPNTHGAGAATYYCVGFASAKAVFQKAMAGIKACDVFFAWVGPDFKEAFGTMVEIGFAKALNKRIVAAMHPNFTDKDAWFAMSCVNEVHITEDPVAGYRHFMSRAKKGTV